MKIVALAKPAHNYLALLDDKGGALETVFVDSFWEACERPDVQEAIRKLQPEEVLELEVRLP